MGRKDAQEALICCSLSRTVWMLSLHCSRYMLVFFWGILVADSVWRSIGRNRSDRAATVMLRTNKRHVETNIDVVLAHCHEDLWWLEQFGGCENIHFHIYSKCGDVRIPTFDKVTDCVTVHRIENCGTAEMAYFQHIVDRYDNGQLAPMTAFIQGGAPHENPHILHDIRSFIPGTSYSDLTRSVKPAWMFKGMSDIELILQNRTNIRVATKGGLWLAAWRSMFMASSSKVKSIDKSIYIEYINNICGKTCGHKLNCNLEVWFSPFFECTPDSFKGRECVTSTMNVTHSIIEEDYDKGGYDSNHGPSQFSTRTTCGNRTIIHSASSVNGILICLEMPEDTSINWHELLKQITNETTTMNLTGIRFGEPPQWYKFDENSALQKQTAWKSSTESKNKTR